MLKEEFKERTGFNPSDECYHQFIEPEYNKSTLDKDVWCKQWKDRCGIQKAYNWEHGMYIEAARERDIEHKNAQHFAKIAEDRQAEKEDIRARWQEAEGQLAELSAMGLRAFIARKIENGTALDEDERQFIKNLLNNK